MTRNAKRCYYKNLQFDLYAIELLNLQQCISRETGFHVSQNMPNRERNKVIITFEIKSMYLH